MPRKKTQDTQDLLSRPLVFRVTESEYKRLAELREKSDCHSVGEVIRRMLAGKQIRLFTKDASLESVTEELAGLREELRAIGVNINQITRHFHSSPHTSQRVLLAYQALAQYRRVGQKVSLLLTLISQLARRW